MELNIKMFLMVCPLVFLGSFVDAIGGGGGLITLPAYIFAGVPMHIALGSNKMSSAIGTVVSTARYWKNKYMDLVIVVPAIVLSLSGAVIGANLALLVEEKILQCLLLFVLPVTAFFVLKNKNFSEGETINRKVQIGISLAAALLIGCYDGFYGPGTGTFLILIFTMLAKTDIKTASGNAKMINLASNIGGLVTFLYHGTVLIPLSLCAALFSIAGHYIGSGMVLKNGTKIVRPIILVVLSILFIKIISDMVL